MKKSFLILFLIFSFLIVPVNAESGSMSVYVFTSKTAYTFSPDSSGGKDFNTLLIDYSDYNTPVTFRAYNTFTAATKSAASTTFTITSGGSGGGIVSYRLSDKSIEWNFDNTTVTSSVIGLTYASNIFADLTTVGEYYSNSGVSLTKPMCIEGGGNHCWFVGSPVISYDADVAANTQLTYSVTYSPFLFNQTPATVFNASIYNRLGNSKVTLYNATGANYFTEPSYYSTPLWFSDIYGNQLWMKMETSTGGISTKLINATVGAGGGTGFSPTTNQILSSKSIYNDTETVLLYGGFFPASNEQDTGYVKILAGGTGQSVGEFSFDTTLTNTFNIFTTLDTGYYAANLYGYLTTNDCAGTTGYAICYVNHGSVNFQVMNQSGNLSIRWIASLPNSTTTLNTYPSIAWTNSTGNDIVTVYDNSGSVKLLYWINNTGQYVSQYGNLLSLWVPSDPKYIGTWRARITNGSNSSHYVEANLNVVSATSGYANNSLGISMYWDKSTAAVGETVALHWTTGTYSGAYQVKIIDSNAYVKRTDAFTAAPGQTQQQSYFFNSLGTYQGQFIDANNTIQASANIVIQTMPATPTPTPEGGAAGGTSNLLSGNFILIILVLLVFVEIGQKIGDFMGAVVGFGSGFIVLGVIGVMPLWALFLFAIIAICAFAVMVGGKIIGVGKD